MSDVPAACYDCGQPLRPHASGKGHRATGGSCETCAQRRARRNTRRAAAAAARGPLKASDNGYSLAAGTARWDIAS